MALIPEQQPAVPPAGPPPSQVAPEDGGAAPDSRTPTPQEQEVYDRTVLAAGKILYEDDTTHKAIVQMLKQGAQDPAKAISDVVVMVMLKLDEQSKGTMPVEVILPAAAEVTDEVGQLANDAGIFKVDQGVLDKSAQAMIVQIGDKYGVSQEGLLAMMAKFSPEERQAAVASQGGLPQQTMQQGVPA
jgi:hypothetical protein